VWLTGLEAELRAADPEAAGIFIVLFVVVAAAMGYMAARTFYRTRLIEDTATSTTRGAHQGYGEFEGRARGRDDAPVMAPLSGLPCCWYRFRVEELRHSRDSKGHSHSRWQVIQQGESDQTFWLEDHTGRIAVDPVDAEMHPRHRDVWQSRAALSGINLATPFFRDFFASHAGNRRYRFTEERINRNDPLYALGFLANLGSHLPQSDLDDRTTEILREWKSDQAALIARFDTDGDGRISQGEWEQARHLARVEAGASPGVAHTEAPEGVNLLARPPAGGLPYILSAWSQAELLSKKRWKLLAFGTLSFLAGGLAAWIYQLRFIG